MNDTASRMVRQKEPYHYQRQRNALHWSYPRAAQPNLSQPNQKFLNGWGMSSFEYWNSISEEYSKRRGSYMTNLALGRR